MIRSKAHNRIIYTTGHFIITYKVIPAKMHDIMLVFHVKCFSNYGCCYCIILDSSTWSSILSCTWITICNFGNWFKYLSLPKCHRLQVTVSKKRHWCCTLNFSAHQPIMVIFGRDVAEWVRYWMLMCYPISPNYVSALPWDTWSPEIGSFQSCSKTTLLWLAISSTLIKQFWYFVDNKIILLSTVCK